MLANNKGYYNEKLSADRLRRCYEIAPPRIRQYLQAEIDFVLSRLNSNDMVLELGCGYGRVLKYLCRQAKFAAGIDTSMASLRMAREYLGGLDNFYLVNTNAITTGLKNTAFNLVCCIQNGISAFKVDNHQLFMEAVRLTRPGGHVLFSSYLAKFWEYRLEWFEIQARERLLGEIDYEKTGNGEIYCKDGFKASTVKPARFVELAAQCGLSSKLHEIDESSIFCEIAVTK